MMTNENEEISQIVGDKSHSDTIIFIDDENSEKTRQSGITCNWSLRQYTCTVL